MSTLNMSLVVEYSSVFDEKVENVEDLIRCIPKNLILKCCAHFIMNDMHGINLKGFGDEIDNWFSIENRDYAIELKRKIAKKYIHQIKGLVLFHPLSSLRIIQYALNTKFENEIHISNTVLEINLFKIYLIVNEQLNYTDPKTFDFIKSKFSDLQPELMALSIGLSVSELINYNFEKQFYCQFVKLCFFNSFLNSNKILNGHLKYFLESFGVDSLNAYAGKLLYFIPLLTKKETKGYVQIRNEESEYDRFLEEISMEFIELQKDHDYLSIRQCPLIKMDSSTYLITHPLLLLDKIYKTIYFKFDFINNELKKSQVSSISNFRQFFTSEFAEKYLLDKIFDYFLKPKYTKFNSIELENMNIDGLPDYYIREGNRIILIENKDALLNAEIKQSNDFKNIIDELYQKFVTKKSGKDSAIKQLVKNISKILNKKLDFDNGYDSQKIIIYPIIIVQDVVFDAPGLNKLFLKWFNDELLNNQELIKVNQIKQIKPLLLINIDSFIITASQLKLNQISLFKLFEILIKHLNINNRSSRERIQEGMMPTSKVIEDLLIKNKYKYLHEEKFMEYAFSL